MRIARTYPKPIDIGTRRQRTIFLLWPRTEWDRANGKGLTRWLERATISETFVGNGDRMTSWAFGHFIDPSL